MIDAITLLAFIPAGLALNLTPGADMMFCLAQGLKHGPRAALASSAGVSAGALVHVTIAGLGLGAAVQALPWLFDVIRWVGVAYLLWLAFQALRTTSASPMETASGTVAAGQAFRSGFFVNISNPKVILFVLAFLPQFVDPAAGSVLAQFLIYGVLLAIGGFVINGAVGAFAAGAGWVLTGSPRARRILDYVTGTIFVGLALRLAVMERT